QRANVGISSRYKLEIKLPDSLRRPSLMSLPRASLGDLKTGLRLLRSLTPALRRPIDLNAARIELKTRLANRESGLLDVLREEMFARSSSPYHRLLTHA